MIGIRIDLEPGFRKGDINSIPVVKDETIVAFIAKAAIANPAVVENTNRTSKDTDLHVDFVQVRIIADVCEARAAVFPAVEAGNFKAMVNVTIKVDKKRNEIIETNCQQCVKKETCIHIMTFLFWLRQKCCDTRTAVVVDFWGMESSILAEEERTEPIRIRDIFACDELRLEADVELGPLQDNEKQQFLEGLLDEMDGYGLYDSTFFKHCRELQNEFEPIFIHHTFLDNAKNNVKDVRSFAQHMDDQSKKGLFERLTEVTKDCYKTPLWLEAQYMRLRCSLIHRIAQRKTAQDDEEIFQTLFCKDREANADERQQIKNHKRFILKQTEKLEHKEYGDCGLLINDSYPYICAAPDGITDDHIVEIKAPKNDDDFERYLENRETIAPKYMAQIQIQMYVANVTKALYCVLSPTFDSNGALHYVWVHADMEFVASLLSAAEDFWREVVFPRLLKMYFERNSSS